jgi:hypothetical protein
LNSVGFELRASHLQGRYLTATATTPAIFNAIIKILVNFVTRENEIEDQ